MSDPLDLEKLRALAEKAVAAQGVLALATPANSGVLAHRYAVAREHLSAAANPQTVLALLLRLEECEKALRPFAECSAATQKVADNLRYASGALFTYAAYQAAASYFQHSEKKADV